MTVLPNQYGDLSGVTLVRDNSSTITTSTYVDFSSTSLNPIPLNSIVTLTLAFDLFNLPAAGISGVTIFALSGSTVGSAIAYTEVTGSTSWVFTMTSWCNTSSVTTCPAGSSNINFRIEGLVNFNSTKPPTIYCNLTI